MSVSIILVAPSLDPRIALGGVSSVARFIVCNNESVDYIHFEQGSRDKDKRGFNRFWRVIRNYKRWVKLLKEKDTSLIHYNFDLSPGSILRDYPFMRYARKHGKKLVIHVHGGIYMNSRSVPFVYNYILKRIFSWDDVSLIVLSKREKEVIESRYGTKRIFILSNCPELPQTNSPHSFRDILNIGYFGRITENKGMKELLEATAILKEKQIPFSLLFAGKIEPPVDYVELFKKELGNNFNYFGIVSGEEKIQFLNALDVFILPSYFEGLPMSLLESMSNGIVPVVTPVGSIPELVLNRKNGLLIKEHDANSIVDAIELLHRDRDLTNRLSAQAKQDIESHYNPQTYIKALNGIYNIS